MSRYQIIEWGGQCNIADNNYLNLVVFNEAIIREQAEIEMNNLNGKCPYCGCEHVEFYCNDEDTKLWTKIFKCNQCGKHMKDSDRGYCKINY